ncbi:MAG TPA: CHASE2 domain-containing protein [Stenomitos sp.]
MSQLVVLNLGKGDWYQGFGTVIAQLWEPHSPIPVQFMGSLPTAPELDNLYQRWQRLYQVLYEHLGWRRYRDIHFQIEVDEDDVTNVSTDEFTEVCQALKTQFNTWLNTEQFRNIDRQLRTRLIPNDEIRLIITAEDKKLLQFPWCLWHFLEDYPNAEIALSPPEFTRSIKAASKSTRGQVKILAILGDRKGIDLNQDQSLLQQLPNAELKLLIEPTPQELNLQLWEPGWDILFFAGHSTSENKGQIKLNSTDKLTIEQLKYGLKKAIAHGLKLAIFNSCDGLGLAWDLADLHIPQVIVMRESVPDLVAQEFLKHFLTVFSEGQSLYTSVREAREKLQALEQQFPCATWLPVICTNPAEVPPNWQDWCAEAASVGVNKTKNHRVQGIPLQNQVEEQSLVQQPQTFPKIRYPFLKPNWHQLRSLILSSIAITSLIVGVRSLGVLQPLELWAFDRFLHLRPEEAPDRRILVITVSEADIQAQGQEERRGSLSDKTLLQLLQKLEQYQPRAIGLDIYRDFPVSSNYPDLAARLRHSASPLIVVCKSRDSENDPAGVSPPPEIPESRLGFSDFVEDDDGVLRRHLLFMTPDPASPCRANYAFSTKLAFRYLEARGISAEFTPEGNLKLGHTIFRRLKKRTSGYQNLDSGGNQVLLNYRSNRSLKKIVPQVTLTQVLSDRIDPNAIKNRVILIGVTTPSSGDLWSTPYGTGPSEKIPGVFIQAQMVSQILSAVLDQRPLLWVWSGWGEVLWIWGWSCAGGLLALVFYRPTHLGLAGTAALGTLSGFCFILFTQGGWVPIIPSLFAVVMTGSTVAYMTLYSDP